MPTNPTLPTLAQTVEEVKKQDWGHEWIQDPYGEKGFKVCSICGDHPGPAHIFICHLKVARAQQAAVAKVLMLFADWPPSSSVPLQSAIKRATDAIEKELENAK